MHFPISFEWFGFSIKLHAILEVLAYFLGFRIYLAMRKRMGDTISDSNRVWIILGAMAGAFLGSRLVGGFENFSLLQSSENKLLFLMANKSMVGGLLGGLWGVEAIKLWMHEKKRSGDLFVYPLLIAMIIGRAGCFSMGIYEDVAGSPTTFFTGMNLGDGLQRHPLMLYEIIFLLLLMVALLFIKNNHHPAEGSLFKIFMISYLLFRFSIEFLKPHESYILGLGAIQLACFAGLMYYGKSITNPLSLFKTPKTIELKTS